MNSLPYRIGQGWDVHALVPGRALVLGGVTIPFERGLLGHSDADALAHALADAMIGAAALGDIGRHFPDTDQRWRGVRSTTLLAAAGALIAAHGWRIGNIDASILAQAPRLAPFIAAMRERVAATLGISPAQVNIKARTGERLGPVGRGECIEAQAVVMLLASAEAQAVP